MEIQQDFKELLVLLNVHEVKQKTVEIIRTLLKFLYVILFLTVVSTLCQIPVLLLCSIVFKDISQVTGSENITALLRTPFYYFYFPGEFMAGVEQKVDLSSHYTVFFIDIIYSCLFWVIVAITVTYIVRRLRNGNKEIMPISNMIVSYSWWTSTILGGYLAISVAFLSALSEGFLALNIASIVWGFIAVIPAFFIGVIGGFAIMLPFFDFLVFLQGAPFHSGDEVLVLRGKYRGQRVPILESWYPRHHIRINMDSIAADDSDALLPYLHFCRVKGCKRAKPIKVRGVST